MIMSYMNTKNNNYYLFDWEKIDDKSQDALEKTKLINFKDYTWDGLKREFLLVGGNIDIDCGNISYAVVGIDTSWSVFLYHIIADKCNKDYSLYLGNNSNNCFSYEGQWWNRFIPKPDQNKEFVITQWCDHFLEKWRQDTFKVNIQNKSFDLVKSETIKCY